MLKTTFFKEQVVSESLLWPLETIFKLFLARDYKKVSILSNFLKRTETIPCRAGFAINNKSSVCVSQQNLKFYGLQQPKSLKTFCVTILSQIKIMQEVPV